MKQIQSAKNIGPMASSELVEKRKAVCWDCGVQGHDAKGPCSSPFCTQKCGAYLEYKWGNEAAKCCISKW